MLESEKKQLFKLALVRHFAAYPNHRVIEGTLNAYWADLGEFPLDLIAESLEKARQHSPQFPPTAPAIREVAKAEAKRRARPAPTPVKRLQAPPELPVGSRWEKLAAYWEQENKHWQAHPESRPSDELVGKQRWAQLWKVWGQAA